METRTRGKRTIDRGLRGSMGTLADTNPTKLSKRSQGCPLTEEHAKAIRRVLQVLQEHKLFLHPKKYEFCKERIKYLGLVISENEVSIDLVKVAGV